MTLWACGGPKVDTPAPAVEAPAETVVAPAVAPEIDEAELLIAAASRADVEDRIEYQHRLIALEPPAIETLARVASSPRASSLERQIAAWALGELAEPEACHVLDVLWLDAIDHPSETQMARAIGLARCGTLYPLRTLLNTGSLVPRLKAAVTLSLLGDTDSALAIEVLRDDPMAAPYLEFFEIALALLGDPRSAAATEHLGSEPLFADYVALGLARSGLEVDLEQLAAAAVGNPEPVVREMAVAEHFALAGPDSASLLQDAMTDPAPRVRLIAETLSAVLELGPIQVE